VFKVLPEQRAIKETLVIRVHRENRVYKVFKALLVLKEILVLRVQKVIRVIPGIRLLYIKATKQSQICRQILPTFLQISS